MASTLTTAKAGTVCTVPAGLAERLVWLRQFGQQRLGVYTKGWHACIQMNTNTTGTSFEIASRFDMATPEAAVEQLVERMLAALATLAAGGDGGRG